MRLARTVGVLLIGLALGACDEASPAGGHAPSAAATASAAPAPSASASSSAAAPVKIPDPPMPPRPVPVGSSGPIQPSAPPEQQMMAITYTEAMVMSRGGDPLVDKDWIDEISKKLEVAVRATDKGKTPANPVKAAKGGRRLEVEMGKGCTDRTPLSLLAQRAGSSLKEAFDHGVLVITCHDDKWKCHQSTRDANDVLCHAAPRH